MSKILNQHMKLISWYEAPFSGWNKSQISIVHLCPVPDKPRGELSMNQGCHGDNERVFINKWDSADASLRVCSPHLGVPTPTLRHTSYLPTSWARGSSGVWISSIVVRAWRKCNVTLKSWLLWSCDFIVSFVSNIAFILGAF